MVCASLCSACGSTTVDQVTGAVVIDYVDRYAIDAEGAEWAQARDEFLKEVGPQPVAFNSYPALEHLVRLAGGRHSRLIVPGRGNSQPPRPPIARTSLSTIGGVGIVTVPGDADRSEQEVIADSRRLAAQIVREQPSRCGWIVDLRNNAGGSVPNTLIGLAPLLPRGDAVVLKDRNGVHRTAYTITGEGVVASPWPPPLDPHQSPISAFHLASGVSAPDSVTSPIAVLQNAGTGSAGEALTLAFKDLSNARSFGTPTAGYSSGNVAEPLPGGATLILTVSVMATRTGRDFAGGPIPPDVLVSEDETLLSAQQWIRRRGCN